MKKVIIFVLFLVISGVAGMNAQVTIGSFTAPEKGVLLQLREKIAEPDTTGAHVINLENASKGLLFPRVALRAFNLLDPLYGTATENPDGTWADAASKEERFRATGMVVFNVNPNTKGLGIGLHVWNVDQWIKVSGDQSDASASISPVRCEDIEVKGTYTQGVPVNDSCFITLKLINVERPGRYSISASSGNGYNFYAEGVLLDVGSTTLKLPCQGVPRVGGESDNIVLAGIETDQSCITTIPVLQGSLTLTGIVSEVSGVYKKQTPLTQANKIHLSVNISETVANCNISVVPQNGVDFAPWTGTLLSGTNTITLTAASGAEPSAVSDISLPITIHTPSLDVTVYAHISITLPRMTYALIGTSADYSWNATVRKRALTLGKAFGPNGVVKIDEFVQLANWSFTSVSSTSSDGAGKKLKEELDKHIVNPSAATLPDIILFFAYDVSGTDSDHETFSHLLSEYINAGGCVIYGAADGSIKPVNTLLKGIFSEITTDVATTQMWGSVWDDNVYQINNLPNDPIVNGPFGNLSNLYWGEDNASSNQIVIEPLPTGGIQICSAWNANGKTSQTKSVSMVWYAPGKNFFYFGDTCGAADNNSGDGYPSYYDNTTGLPKSKKYGPSPQQTIYNSALELNAVAWAIKAAANNGINYK